MVLDDKQKEKVTKTLLQKWPKPRLCSVCNQQQWTIAQEIFEIRQFHAGELVLGGPLLPVIVATCRNCGNTLFFNAVLLGIVQSETKGGKE